MTTTFYISFNGRNIKANILIDSGSGRSFLCKIFITDDEIPAFGLTSPINIQLPNGKSMTIKQITKSLKLKIMDHAENFELCVGTLSLLGINGILGRDWLSKHNPYINYEINRI